MKRLIIGDIHGCFDEFQDLLEKAGLSSEDEIISIGDLVNRGPASDQVMDFFMHTPKARSIMGNHEHKHLRAVEGEIIPTLSILLAHWQIGSSYPQAIAYFKSLPTVLELREALIVHAYYEPSVPVAEQKPYLLLGTMGAGRYLSEHYKKPWYTYYQEDQPIIVGHKDMSGKQQPFVYNDRVYGIDTGCVYGGRLTGILLPEFRFISVPSRRSYWQDTLEHYTENE